MTTLNQQLLQEGFVTQLNGNQLDFYHNKYKTTIKNPTNVPFETLVTLLKAIRKIDKNNVDITINDNQSIFIQNDHSKQTTVDNLQETLKNVPHIRKEN
jgi:hypothetical protein